MNFRSAREVSLIKNLHVLQLPKDAPKRRAFINKYLLWYYSSTIHQNQSLISSIPPGVLIIINVDKDQFCHLKYLSMAINCIIKLFPMHIIPYCRLLTMGQVVWLWRLCTCHIRPESSNPFDVMKRIEKNVFWDEREEIKHARVACLLSITRLFQWVVFASRYGIHLDSTFYPGLSYHLRLRGPEKRWHGQVNYISTLRCWQNFEYSENMWEILCSTHSDYYLNVNQVMFRWVIIWKTSSSSK